MLASHVGHYNIMWMVLMNLFACLLSQICYHNRHSNSALSHTSYYVAIYSTWVLIDNQHFDACPLPLYSHPWGIVWE